jgi:hypothetical protein
MIILSIAGNGLIMLTRLELEPNKTMKNSIHTFAVATLIAAFASTTAHATSRVVNQGRAGYTVATKTEPQTGARSATIVALAMEKPQQGPSRMHTTGRAGYAVVPNTMSR